MTGQKFHYDEELSRSQKVVALAPDMIAQRQCIHHALNLQPGERVLDIGSGNGLMVQEMAEAVGPDGLSAGVDAAETMTSIQFAISIVALLVSLQPAYADNPVTTRAKIIDVISPKITTFSHNEAVFGLSCVSGPVGEVPSLKRLQLGDRIAVNDSQMPPTAQFQTEPACQVML